MSIRVDSPLLPPPSPAHLASDSETVSEDSDVERPGIVKKERVSSSQETDKKTIPRKRSASPEQSQQPHPSALKRHDADLEPVISRKSGLSAIEQVRKYLCTPKHHHDHREVQELAHKIGLKVSVTTNVLLERLRTVAAGDLKSIKTAEESFHWWLKSHRPTLPVEHLRPYAFTPFRAQTYHIMPQELLEPLAKLTGITPEQRMEFDEVGSINHLMFKWWHTSGIFDIFLQEIEMYRFHYQADEKGWLRNCFYSLAQQAMRMDIRYWIAYVLFRPDHRAWLMSYPYYCKYQLAGQQTAFRHPDINIEEMANAGRGVNMIQGTLSLTNERVDDCTEIVPGLHKPQYLQEWARRWLARDGPSGLIHAIPDELLTTKDLRDFGNTKWTPSPCRKLEVRISHPALAHGAIGPSKSKRITLMPWFVGIEPDHHGLEVPQSGTWEELAAAHSKLMPGPTSPSGFPNKYGAITFSFPAATPMAASNPISQALVGRRKFDGHVFVYLQRLLTEPGLINEYQTEFAKSVKTHFKQIEAMERAVFGTGDNTTSKSFFEHRAWGTTRPKPDFPHIPGVINDKSSAH